MKIGLCDNPHRRAAFTLAELLISVAIASIIFVSLYAGIYLCFNVTRFERENLRATQIMLEHTEALRLLTWPQVQNDTINPKEFYERYYPGSSGVAEASGITYTGKLDFAEADLPGSTYGSNVLKVTVTVTWTSAKIPRKRSFSTYVAKNGMQNYVYAK